MTSAYPMAERPGGDADARFAAYLADVATHVDDPDDGDEYRAILAEDPQTQRAWFDVIEDMSSAPTHNPATVLALALTTLVAVAALAALAVWVLP